MESFYLNTHKDHLELLMFGGTTRTCQERRKQHNSPKSTIGEWDEQHCEEVESYRTIEQYFFDNYSKLHKQGESREIVHMTLEEGMYVLDMALGRATVTSPFAINFYEQMNSYKTRMVDVDTLTAFQTRPETKAGHIKRLAESMDMHGFFTNEPLVLWINNGKTKIVSGHHRFWAAKDANIEEVPAIYLPKYFDEKTAKDIGWLTNVDHNLALQLTDKSVKSKIEGDAVKFGIDFIETNLYKEDCMKIFNRNKRSIGKFVGSVKRQTIQKELEQNSSFRYDKKEIGRIEEDLVNTNLDSQVAMIAAGNWREQLGGNLLIAIRNSKKDLLVQLYWGKLMSPKSVKDTIEKIKLTLSDISKMGINVSLKITDQTD